VSFGKGSRVGGVLQAPSAASSRTTANTLRIIADFSPRIAAKVAMSPAPVKPAPVKPAQEPAR